MSRTTNAVLGLVVAVTALVIAGCGALQSMAPDPLDGMSWELAALGDAVPLPDYAITANFDQGRVYGSAGCNTYGASYQITGSRITIGPIAMTEMGCVDPEGIMEQEMAYVSVLAKTETFDLSENGLGLGQPDGTTLIFIPTD